MCVIGLVQRSPEIWISPIFESCYIFRCCSVPFLSLVHIWRQSLQFAGLWKPHKVTRYYSLQQEHGRFDRVDNSCMKGQPRKIRVHWTFLHNATKHFHSRLLDPADQSQPWILAISGNSEWEPIRKINFINGNMQTQTRQAMTRSNN